jgi:hypothetical protein
VARRGEINVLLGLNAAHEGLVKKKDRLASSNARSVRLGVPHMGQWVNFAGMIPTGGEHREESIITLLRGIGANRRECLHILKLADPSRYD